MLHVCAEGANTNQFIPVSTGSKLGSSTSKKRSLTCFYVVIKVWPPYVISKMMSSQQGRLTLGGLWPGELGYLTVAMLWLTWTGIGVAWSMKSSTVEDLSDMFPVDLCCWVWMFRGVIRPQCVRMYWWHNNELPVYSFIDYIYQLINLEKMKNKFNTK